MSEESSPGTEYTPLVETQYVTFGSEQEPFELRCGKSLPGITIAYETWGDPKNKDRAILVLHALTGDAHAAGYHAEDINEALAKGREPKPGWWDPMIGPGKPFDTDKFFVICSNVLGGCKGSTGPSSINPETGRPWGSAFPFISIKDMVNAQVKLIDHLGIDNLFCVAGGSMGGMQALRWAVDHPHRVRSAIPIATTARHSAQNIAFYEVGRHAIISDPAFMGGDYYGTEGPRRGLAMARMMAHITYMSEKSLHEKFARRIQDPIRNEQADPVSSQDNASLAARESGRRGTGLPQFQVNSYLHHQGSTFVDRFDANSYIVVTRALDYFDLGADFDDDLGSAFVDTQAEFLVISFSSDWHYPPRDSKNLVNAMRANDIDVTYSDITADWGHDSFLVKEVINGKLGFLVKSFLDNLDKELADADTP
ncbi:MAG TPA: homoserine O-acetyltransferase [Spirochaetota bacterium]|nr:homoserine O-acetyltransferase [Spirochaetota bacterium]